MPNDGVALPLLVGADGVALLLIEPPLWVVLTAPVLYVAIHLIIAVAGRKPGG